jgi:SAM-dependent methyltransferase
VENGCVTVDSDYDLIGRTYSRQRRTDPRMAAPIFAALGDARSIVNVGAGTGSYEPDDRRVVAVEPSTEMIRQRAADAAPVVRAVAEALPFEDETFDAALAVLTVHHWTDWRGGLSELKRVAGRCVVLTSDMSVFGEFWLVKDYFPQILELDLARFPTVEELVDALDGATVQTVYVPRDCVDGFTAAYWARPEAYLDAIVRSAMSGLAVLDLEVVDQGIARLSEDLRSGRWDDRYGGLREADTFDGSYRLLVG